MTRASHKRFSLLAQQELHFAILTWASYCFMILCTRQTAQSYAFFPRVKTSLNMNIKLTEKPSPITTETVALSGRSFGELQSVGGKLFYHCRDPERKGLCHVEAIVDEKSSFMATPAAANVRSVVHEYGGGSYLAVELNESFKYIIYTDFNHGNKLCAVPFTGTSMQDHDQEVITLYPIDETNNKAVRFADFEYDRHRHRLICIMEDHTDPKPSQVVNSIVSVSLHPLMVHAGLSDAEEQSEHPKLIECLAKGNDFYSTPKLSPDGTALAFVTWNHPRMPWFVTELCIQPLHPDGYPRFDELCVVHGDKSKADDQEGAVSVCDPRWDPHRHKLYFVSDVQNGYYNLFVWDGQESKCILPKQADFTDAGFGWVFRTSPYVIRPDGTLFAIMDGATLVKIDPDYQITEYGHDVIPPTSLTSLCLTDENTLHFLGGSPLEPVNIYKWSMLDNESATVVIPSIDPNKVDLSLYQPYMSAPQKISFPNRRGTVSHAYFYPPKNTLVQKPPLLVKAHGGPTSQTSTTFRLSLQYWTSRGFAILDVDYGGSLGYGRKVCYQAKSFHVNYFLL